MTTAIQDRLDLSTNSSTELEVVKNYLKIGNNADDDLIDTLITAAKEDVDGYLNNPFTEVRSQVVVGSPSVGERVDIDGEVFTVASSTSVEDREFADASGLVDCINSDLIDVNGEDVGIPYLTASNDSGTVTLEQADYHFEDVDVTSTDEDGLKVQYKRFDLDIPDNVADATLKVIANKYVKRVDGLEAESSEHGGSGSMRWGEIKREYLDPYREINV